MGKVKKYIRNNTINILNLLKEKNNIIKNKLKYKKLKLEKIKKSIRHNTILIIYSLNKKETVTKLQMKCMDIQINRIKKILKSFKPKYKVVSYEPFKINIPPEILPPLGLTKVEIFGKLPFQNEMTSLGIFERKHTLQNSIFKKYQKCVH